MPSIGAFWMSRKALKESCSFPGVAFTYAAIDVCPPRPLNIAVPDLFRLSCVVVYLRGVAPASSSKKALQVKKTILEGPPWSKRPSLKALHGQKDHP
jgi:hypothetical protein